MQKRMLYSDIWDNRQFALLSPEARLLFIGMITLGDDEGRFRADVALLRSKIFPRDDVPFEKVQKLRNEIKETGLIVIYRAGDEDYGYHPNWLKYQVLRSDRRKESNIPIPENFVRPEDEIILPNNPNIPRKLAVAIYQRDGAQCRYCGSTERPFHIDHIHPVIKGGETTLSNLLVSCEHCNTSKKERTLEELGWKIRPLPPISKRVRIKDGQMSDKRLTNVGIREEKVTKEKVTKHNTPPKNKFSARDVVVFFFELKGWESKKPKQTIFKRYLRVGKELLQLCEGDMNEVRHCLSQIKNWAESRDLDWSIETVFKKWYELDRLKPKEKKPHWDGCRIFQKSEGGRWWIIRNGEILELGRSLAKEEIEWK